MNEAWKRGYAWAGDKGEHGKLDCEDAMEAYGYDFGSQECEQFMAGVECGQDELAEGIYKDA